MGYGDKTKDTRGISDRLMPPHQPGCVDWTIAILLLVIVVAVIVAVFLMRTNIPRAV